MGYKFKGLYFDDFELNEKYYTASRTVTEADIQSFAGLSGDYNPLHTNEIFAKKTPFGTRIAHGVLSFAISTGLVNQLGIFDGTTLAFIEANVKFVGPVKPGDTIRVELTCEEKTLSSKGGRGVVVWNVDVFNQDDVPVLKEVWKLMMVAKK